ncbi:hypothetical protein ACM66B_006044 [Microbotryomycetes sp. NB124-2]
MSQALSLSRGDVGELEEVGASWSAMSFPTELVQLIVNEVQSEQRAQLLDIKSASRLRPAATLNATRCRALFKLALVSRQWHAIANEAMFEIIVMTNWYPTWFCKNSEAGKLPFATDPDHAESRLETHGHSCRVLYIDMHRHDNLSHESSHLRQFCRMLRHCSSANVVRIACTVSEHERVATNVILGLLTSYPTMHALHLAVAETSNNFECEQLLVLAPNSQLKHLILDGFFPLAIIAPLDQVSIEHLTVSGCMPVDDEYPWDQHPLQDMFAVLAPKLRTLDLRAFQLTSGVTWQEDVVLIPLADIIKAAVHLERAQLGFYELQFMHRPEEELRQTLENLSPSVTYLETSNDLTLTLLVPILSSRDARGHFNYLLGLRELLVTSDGESIWYDFESHAQYEQACQRRSRTVTRLQDISRQRAIQLRNLLKPLLLEPLPLPKCVG